MRSPRSHGVKPQAFFMRVISDNALIGKGVLAHHDHVALMLEVENAAVVFMGAVIPKLGEDSVRHD